MICSRIRLKILQKLLFALHCYPCGLWHFSQGTTHSFTKRDYLDEVTLLSRCDQHLEHSVVCTAPLAGTVCPSGTFHGTVFIPIFIEKIFKYHAWTRTWYHTGCCRALKPLSYPCGTNIIITNRYCHTHTHTTFQAHIVIRLIC